MNYAVSKLMLIWPHLFEPPLPFISFDWTN